LNNAINSRLIIDQAIGKIRQTMRCELEDAFNRMRAHAENHREGLTVTARRIVSQSTSLINLDEFVKEQGRSESLLKCEVGQMAGNIKQTSEKDAVRK